MRTLFYLDRSPSKDLKRAIRVAAHYGWRHTGIAIPTASMADDFIRLAVEYGCLQVHFEVMYPMLARFPHDSGAWRSIPAGMPISTTATARKTKCAGAG